MTPEEREKIEGPAQVVHTQGHTGTSLGVWRHPATIGGLYLFTEEDQERLGSGKWKPLPGDYCVCKKLSGDCFYEYIGLRQVPGLTKMVHVGWGEFGAYVFGKRVLVLDEDSFHRLCLGMPIAFCVPTEEVAP
jgi:hypothetical protein